MEAGVKYLSCSINNGNTSYYVVRKSKRNEVYWYVLTIEPKGFGQRFEERRRGRPADVFNIIQKRPYTVVHLKVDEAAEGRRSHKKIK